MTNMTHFHHSPPCFLCVRNHSRETVAAPSRPRMITSRRPPPPLLLFRTSHPPYNTHATQHAIPWGSIIAVLRTKITGSRPAWLRHTVFGFCAAHDKSEPAREDASPPTAVQRHIIILGRRRVPVPRSNTERRSLARVPEPTPHGRLRPITPPRFEKSATLSSHHDMHITSPHHYICITRTDRPDGRRVTRHLENTTKTSRTKTRISRLFLWVLVHTYNRSDTKKGP